LTHPKQSSDPLSKSGSGNNDLIRQSHGLEPERGILSELPVFAPGNTSGVGLVGRWEILVVEDQIVDFVDHLYTGSTSGVNEPQNGKTCRQTTDHENVASDQTTGQLGIVDLFPSIGPLDVYRPCPGGEVAQSRHFLFLSVEMDLRQVPRTNEQDIERFACGFRPAG
jgi:hypothetical protein